MTIVLKTSKHCERAARVCHKTHLIREVEPMPIAPKTSNTAIVQRVCVSQGTPVRRGRADVDRAQDLQHC